MPRLKIAIVVLLGMLTLFTARPSRAWWGGGHIVIAILAYREMKPATRTAVDALLKTHPDYAQWQAELPAGITDDRRNSYLFAIAATWPDRIKDARDSSVTIKFYDPARRRGSGPLPADSHYPDLILHSEWHYVDFPIAADGKTHTAPAEGDALTTIDTFRTKVGNTSLPASFRAYYLAWIEHLVGDVHQPLHATSRYSDKYPDGDRGGNSVLLDHVGKEAGNLHSYWDGLLGDGGSGPGSPYYVPTDWKALEATVAAVNTDATKELAGIDPATRDDLKPEDWAHESYAYDQNFVYTIGPDADGSIPQPDAAYREIAIDIAHQRAALAGHRLALLLDGALASATY